MEMTDSDGVDDGTGTFFQLASITLASASTQCWSVL